MAGILNPSEFLADAALKPFEWGRHDCFLLAADWVLACTGIDPAERWRGSYHSARGAVRAMRRSGGLIALAHDAMAGFAKTDDPRDGDVAIVHGAFERCKGEPWASHAAAVRCGARWVVKTPSGMIGNREPLITPVTAWRVA